MANISSEMASESSPKTATLIDLLDNSVILARLAPYLQLASKLALTATCTACRTILYDNPETFRYMDLSYIKSAQIGSVPIHDDEPRPGITEDEFYGGPLRDIFSRLEGKGILESVRTLVLDGLCVTAELVREIISDNRFDVRILSIREVTHINDRRLQQVLEYAVRPSRPEGSPSLKGLYLFGRKPVDPGILPGPQAPDTHLGSALAPSGVTNSEGAQLGGNWSQSDALGHGWNTGGNQWYQPQGILIHPGREPFAWTMTHCEGVIAFDAVLCRGPRHDITTIARNGFHANESRLDPAIADTALGTKGCEVCGSISESPGVYGESPSHHLPLLDPLPIHSSSVREAQRPGHAAGEPNPPLFVRCRKCLANRYCERCGKFWDETCLPNTPDIRQKVRGEQT